MNTEKKSYGFGLVGWEPGSIEFSQPLFFYVWLANQPTNQTHNIFADWSEPESAKTLSDLELVQKEREKYIDTSQLISIAHNSEELLTTEYDNQKIITTGFPSIDKKLGCMQGGDFIILAGATGMGKTFFYPYRCTSV